MNNKNHEAQLFSFYMHEAAAHPLSFLETVKSKTTPTYWEEFWGYYAALRMEDEDYVAEMYKKYIEEEDDDGNDFYILLGYDAYLDHVNRPEDEECLPIGHYLLMTARDSISPLLKDAFHALHTLLSTESGQLPVEENFYTQRLFVPQKFLTIDSVLKNIDQTKSREEWLREINYLSDRLEFFHVESMLSIPEGWTGITRLDLTPFHIVERGKPVTCYGLWKEGEKNYSLCISADKMAPQTLPLGQIRNMASLQTIALLILGAISGAQEGPTGWE